MNTNTISSSTTPSVQTMPDFDSMTDADLVDSINTNDTIIAKQKAQADLKVKAKRSWCLANGIPDPADDGLLLLCNAASSVGGPTLKQISVTHTDTFDGIVVSVLNKSTHNETVRKERVIRICMNETMRKSMFEGQNIGYSGEKALVEFAHHLYMIKSGNLSGGPVQLFLTDADTDHFDATAHNCP